MGLHNFFIHFMNHQISQYYRLGCSAEMESMDARLVAQALNYHGQQLQKVWESERNDNELVMLNLKEPSFEIYQQRQKTLRYLQLNSFPNFLTTYSMILHKFYSNFPVLLSYRSIFVFF